MVVVVDKQQQYKLMEKLGKNIHKKKYLELWHMSVLDPNMIILGRDSMKALKLKIYDDNDIKRVICFKTYVTNIIPSDEDTNII